MEKASLTRIRMWVAVFIAGLLVSGATALPLEAELTWLTSLRALAVETAPPALHGLAAWLATVRDALVESNTRWPFLAYGTDWLAFAHFVIAVAFLGVWRDPVRNQWVVTFGLIACAAVIPWALGMGGVRGIPFGWRLLDCAFGVFGAIPLLAIRRHIGIFEAATPDPAQRVR